MGKKVVKKETKKLTCSCCGNEYDETKFAKSYSYKDKVTGRLSICKDCCADLFDKELVKYQDEMKALYRFCMELDIYFKKEWADSSITQGKNTNKNIAVTYINKCGLPQFGGKTFADTTDIINIYEITDDELNDILILTAEKQKANIEKEVKMKITPEIIKRWGEGLDYSDYVFLEERFQLMLNSYTNNNIASTWIISPVC